MNPNNLMIAIIAYEKYPDGAAGAIRCKSFAESYAKLGFNVVVIHKGTFEQASNPKVISCYDSNRFKKYFCFEHKAIDCLDIINKQYNLQAVLSYGFFKGVNKWCRKNNILNVVDVVEFYSKEQFKRWFLSYNYWRKQFEINNIVKHKANVIAISSYLNYYFIRNGCKSVRIPIISDCSIPVKSNIHDMNTIYLIYAGTHALMDNVLLILKSLLMLPEYARKRIKFSIYGLGRDFFNNSFTPSEQSVLDSCVTFYGRRPNKEVLTAYSQSHFSIFLRNPELRVNKAGFPSKVIESMRMGVPVLCNYSSDLNRYLVSGVNSIIVDNLSEDELYEMFIKILELSQNDFSNLRKNAITTVETKFCAEAFSEEFLEILN